MKKQIKLTALLLAVVTVLCLLLTSCENGVIVKKTSSTQATSTTITSTTTTTTLGSSTTTTTGPKEDEEPLPAVDLTFSLIKELVEKYSLKEVNYEAAMVAAMQAFISASGDKYAYYYDQEEWEEYQLKAEGSACGIGVNTIFNYDEKEIEILFVNPKTPAEEAGLRAGMKITHIIIDGIRVPVLSIIEQKRDEFRGQYETEEELENAACYEAYQYVLSKIKGEIGTQAEFAITEESGRIVNYSVTRGQFTALSVRHRVSIVSPDVGIIFITGFNQSTPGQFRTAMNDLISKGVDKFVFDLRNNPGGTVDSVCAILSYFLNEGDLIMSTVDTNGNEVKRYATPVTYTYPSEGSTFTGFNVSKEEIGMYAGYKMSVLVNDSTASAAEIFAANMRDYELANIVGVKTFGKGSVQTIIPLSRFGDDYPGALKLTTKLYFPPCGKGYDGGVGIMPDYFVELDESVKNTHIYKLNENNDDQLKKAVSLLLEGSQTT